MKTNQYLVIYLLRFLSVATPIVTIMAMDGQATTTITITSR